MGQLQTAKSLLADQFLLDTYDAWARHQIHNGNLPRDNITNVEGNRGGIYRLALSLPKPSRNRIFEGWQTWKEVRLSNGRACYLMGITPLRDYHGSGFDAINLKKEGFKFAEYRGLCVFVEIAPEVCRFTRIGNVDLKSKNIPDKIVNYLARCRLDEGDRIMSMHRRNGKKVDAEVRAVLIESMLKGEVKLEEDQKPVFTELEDLFEGDAEAWRDEKEGWDEIESPYQGE